MAVSQHDKLGLDQADQDKIANLTSQAERGEISWSDAHSQAEAIRNQYGYSGGRYGDEFISIDPTGGFGNTPVSGSASSGSSSGGSYGGSEGSGKYKASDYTEYLKDMYAQNLEAQLAGLKSSYEQNVKDLQAEAEAIPKRYYEARNETAAQNELQRQYFNEMAAANGLNTGASGQAALASSATLQGNLSSISEQEKDALAANALEQNKLAIAYENAINQATASGNAAMAQALYNEWVRQDQANMAQQQWQAQFDFSKQQYQDSLSQYQDSINAQNRDNAYNLAMTMLGAGVMPDANTLTTAGISTADAMAIRLAALGGEQASETPKKTSNPPKVMENDPNGTTTLTVDRDNLPSYSTILGNSEVGYYGPEYGKVLNDVQAISQGHINTALIQKYMPEEIVNGTISQAEYNKILPSLIEVYLLKQMDAGKINEYGVATILQALGMQRG